MDEYLSLTPDQVRKIRLKCDEFKASLQDGSTDRCDTSQFPDPSYWGVSNAQLQIGTCVAFPELATPTAQAIITYGVAPTCFVIGYWTKLMSEDQADVVAARFIVDAGYCCVWIGASVWVATMLMDSATYWKQFVPRPEQSLGRRIVVVAMTVFVLPFYSIIVYTHGISGFQRETLKNHLYPHKDVQFESDVDVNARSVRQ